MPDRYDTQTIESLRQELERKREELTRERGMEETAREQLGQREPEQQERALAEQKAQRLHSEDEHTRQQLWEIDAALSRMELGNYGLCSACGELIAESRLKAVPWTRYCINCMDQGVARSSAKAAEDVGLKPESTLPSAQPAPLPADFQGLDEEQFRSVLLERLAQDDRLPVQELQPRLEESRLVMEGAVPSDADRQLLTQVLHDRLGFNDYIDRLHVDPMLWKREFDRQPSPENTPRSDAQELLEGESAEEDLQQAMEQGGSVLSPDRFHDPREPES